MSIKTFWFGLFVFSVIWLFIPGLLIYLNTVLGLPVYKNAYMQGFGIVFIFLALLISWYVFYLFHHQGFGTPVPIDPPKKFVIKGIYKYTRNPMYWGYMASFLGYFLLFGHSLLLGYFFFSIAALHLYVLAEESLLKKRFGDEYEKYCQQVPRWGIKI